jgi:membrane peptidoglycan carboxypeptidase
MERGLEQTNGFYRPNLVRGTISCLPFETLGYRKHAARQRRNADKSDAIAHVMSKVLIWIAGTLATLFVVAFLTIAALAGWVYWDWAKSLPEHRLAAETSSWRGCVSAGSKDQFVPLAAIPENAVSAFLASEDPDFFYHPAYSPVTQIIRALRGMRPQRTVSILSTMYARKLFACHNSSAGRNAEWHFKIALLTCRIERDLPKRNILETVINTLYFGRGSYGIAAGAEAYFHKPLSVLSLAEMALLGGLVSGPSLYDESLVKADRDLERRNKILESMARMGASSPQQAETAKREPLSVQNQRPVSKKEL